MPRESAANNGTVPPLRYLPKRLGLILILSLTFGSLAMIAAVWWYYKVQSRETEAATTRQLFAVALGKSDQIANWRHERVGDGRVAMSASVMRIARRVLSGRAVIADDRAEVLDLMTRLSSQFLYSDAALVDLDGNVTLRLHEGTTEAGFGKRSRGELAREAVKTRDVVLSDLTPDTRTGRPLMALTVPIDDLGALILDIDPSRFLYPSLESWPGNSRTAETLLVRMEGNQIVNLSKMRNAPGNSLFSRRPKSLTRPYESVVDAGWSVEGPDYRGVPTIGTIRRVPDSPWLVACKIDVSEVDAPLRRLGWEMALVTALIGLANAAGVGLIWRGQQTRVHHEREAWFFAVANDTPAYLWMWSVGQENSFINRSLGKFLGTDEQRLSKGWTDYVHPEDAEHTRANLMESVAAGRSYTQELRLRRFDGTYRWVVSEAVPRYLPGGELVGFAGSVLDITDRRQAEEQLRSANAALVRQLEEQIRKEQVIEALGARLIGAQEEERKRLARELHDDLNQQIAALSIAMGNLKRHLPEQLADARAQSDRIHQKLVQVAETVRRMSHELHPAMLQYSGLAAALQSYCNEFGALTGIAVSVTIEGEFDGVPSGAALCMYRVTQEALRNIAKHAKVAAAAVEMRHSEGLLSLTVSDQGVGMDPASAEATAGLGLVSIRERARFAGGSVEIASQPNQGTAITVRIQD
ncbi:MAG TPA: PAS domain-containing protein [Bryobacteraceae bacterium]|nr:PAS domain-containing protein [Bryobacteraceae bacterium]